MSNEIKNYSDIKKTIWYFLDMLRSNNLLENFNIAALILFLKTENLAKNICWRLENYSDLTIVDAIEGAMRDFGMSLNEYVGEELIKIFSKDLYIINKKVLIKSLNLIEQIENNEYQIYAGDIIDDVYQEIAHRIGKRSETFIQPKEITELIHTIANLPSGAYVYNPFAGLASYAIGLNFDCHYYGQELNRNVWALGIIRLLAHSRIKNENFKCEDSILNWKESYPVFDFFLTNPNPAPRFDLIVSTPPFGMRIETTAKQSWFNNARTAEDFLLSNGINSLSQSGKMILVVSKGVLSNGNKSSLEIRKNLIEKDLLEFVISLPSGIFNSTGISTSVLIINKDKKKRGTVRFVNGETFYIQQNNGKILATENLLENVLNEIESDISRTCTLSEIRKNDYNLNPNMYFLKDVEIPEGFELKELREVLATIKRNNNHNDLRGRFVQISDLSNNPVDFEKSFSEKEIIDLKKYAVKVNKSALLISKISLNLKPTYFTYTTNNPIYLNLYIEAFAVKENIVQIPYLVNELYSEYVQEQLNAFSSGSTIASLSLDNFLSLKILIPTLARQKEIIYETRKKIILEKENELKSLKTKFEQQTFEEFASLKHALGKPIPGIATAIEYIYEYMQKNEGKPISLNDIVSNRRKTTLQDKFDVVNNGLKLIQILLQKGDNGLVIENYPLQSYKIVRYIKDYCKSYSSDKFIINVYDNNDECNDIEISTNKDLITILLNDVLSNANNHAFADFDLEKNKVDIFISVIENHLHLLIANNGTSFPENFDQSKFVQKYQKAGDNSGAGIGGYDINRITQYFNGTFNLITEPMDGYYTIYQFIFTVLDLKEENNE